MSSSWTCQIELAVSAPRLFKATVLEWHDMAPKVAAGKIVSATPGEGFGSVGTTRQLNYAPGFPFTFVKERLDFIDVEKCEAKLSAVEGGGLGTHIESASTHTKVEPKDDGGCVVKVSRSYVSLPGVDVTREIEESKANFSGFMKGCEAYLVANPDAYI